MATQVKFNLEDNTVEVVGKINNSVEKFLTEASGEIVSMTARNSRVDTGQLKSSWSAVVKGNVAYIGSPLENAIWEEFGTGIFAETVAGVNGEVYGSGVGRKTGWAYENRKGETVFTRGKRRNPKGLLYSFKTVFPKLEEQAKKIFGKELK